MVDLPGTVVLNYDISGPATRLASTAVAVYITDSGANGTSAVNGEVALVTSGNAHAGVVDLDGGTGDQYLEKRGCFRQYSNMGRSS